MSDESRLRVSAAGGTGGISAAQRRWPAAMSTASLATRLLLVLMLACVLIPFSPGMPGEGLDPSWVLAINQAVAQGLVFGREVIFSYGPFGSVLTRNYHPSTDALMVFGGLHLVLAFSVALMVLSVGRLGVGLVGVAFAVGAMTYLRDALLFWYPLLVALCCDRLFRAPSEPPRTGEVSRLWLLALLCSPFGLLPLIKGSMLVSCGVVAGLLLLQFALERRWQAACVVVTVPLAWMLACWTVAGQPLDALPTYFRMMLPVIAGYTAAMSSDGVPWEPIAYLAGACWLLAVLWLDSDARGPRRFVLPAVFALSLFLAFKAAFVRHDGHALIAGSFLLLSALSLNLQWPSRRAVSALVVATGVWALIDDQYLGTGPVSSARSIQEAMVSAWSGVERRVAGDGGLQADFDASLAGIREGHRLRVLDGRADIYSFNQSHLLAAGARWSPRPVFQSYSAYTPELAEKNRRHLLSDAAPESIVFRVEPIDGRVPASEDGASWPLLMSAYRPVALENDTLYLARRTRVSSHSDAAGHPADAQVVASLGEPVVIPRNLGPVFARIDVRPTLLGRLAGLLYKPSELRMGVRLDDGRTRSFRFVVGSGPAGLVVSPLIESTAEFALLYGGHAYLSAKRVESFWVTAERPARFWSSRYTVSFERLVLGEPVDVGRLVGLDTFASLDGVPWGAVAPGCDGNIDAVNGVAPGVGAGAPAFGSDSLLSVSGWLALSTKTADLPDRVLLVLTDPAGARAFVEPRRTRRLDLGEHFAVGGMADAGFEAAFDVSGLRGRHLLALAYEKGGTLHMCPQFAIPVTLRGGV
jgi:hypothetical protein